MYPYAATIRLSHGSPVQPLEAVRILVVEDDLDLLAALAGYLERLGASVVGAASVAAAQRALASGGLDLLISDIDLPDGSGHVLAREARARGMAALALSGRRGEADVVAAHAAGFQTYLKKPCSTESLVRAALLLLSPEP